MLCVLILYISGNTYSLKSTPNDTLFEKLFMAILFTLRVFGCWEEIAEEILFVFRFWCLAWGSNLGFSSNNPTHYLLDHGDFNIYTLLNNWKVLMLHYDLGPENINLHLQQLLRTINLSSEVKTKLSNNSTNC